MHVHGVGSMLSGLAWGREMAGTTEMTERAPQLLRESLEDTP